MATVTITISDPEGSTGSLDMHVDAEGATPLGTDPTLAERLGIAMVQFAAQHAQQVEIVEGSDHEH